MHALPLPAVFSDAGLRGHWQDCQDQGLLPAVEILHRHSERKIEPDQRRGVFRGVNVPCEGGQGRTADDVVGDAYQLAAVVVVSALLFLAIYAVTALRVLV
jgi:hypothetical protein